MSTNTTLIPRSTVFAPLPASHSAPAPQPTAAPQPQAALTHDPNFMRMARESLGALQPPEARTRSNSWLLGLDDARAGRAGVEPVVPDPSRRAPVMQAPAQLEASFAEALPVSARTMPWLVRGLIAAAAGSFLFVVGHTLLSPKLAEQEALVVPPTARTSPLQSGASAELSDPGPRVVTSEPETGPGRAKNQPKRPVPASPARPSLPPAATTAPVVEEPPPTFIEIAPADFAPRIEPPGTTPTAPNAAGAPQTSAADYALPPWYPEMVSATPLARGELGPAEGELAASPERKARVQSYLMQQSRGAAPLEDADGTYTPAVSKAGLGSIGSAKRNSKSQAALKAAAEKPATPNAQRAGGVWDGVVVPVDQISSKVQILTPRVGLVRITLASGDVKEGRLNSVGQGYVWVEQPRGVEAIAKSRIERLEQVSAPKDVLAFPGEKSPAPTIPIGANARVRVRTAGGLFYGKIVSREGDTITLQTDEGAVVTIEGGTVEAAPERKTIVKREPLPSPVAPKAPTPAPAADTPGEYDHDDPHGLRPKPATPPGT